METLGRHVIIELYGCDHALLDDLDRVRAAMLEATGAIGATVLSDAFHRFEPHGLSGTVVIAESHLSIHTWPESGYAAIDIFTCGSLQAERGLSVLRSRLGAQQVRTQEIVRGLPQEVDERLRPEHVAITAGPLGLTGVSPNHQERPRGLDLERGWFFEGTVRSRPDSGVHGFRVERVIHAGRTPFHDVVIFDNPVYGRVLALDGIVQLSTSDARLYHEFLVHPAMLAHAAPRRVLIVGGGDGAALREVLAHDPDEIVLVDIDRTVIDLCRRHIPELSDGAFDDPRVHVVIGDAASTLPCLEPHFDVVILDGSDGLGPSLPLYDRSFYRQIRRVLAEDGVCAVHAGPFLAPAFVRQVLGDVQAALGACVVRRLTVPSLHCGESALVVAGALSEPTGAILDERMARRRLAPLHYSRRRHATSVVDVASSPLAP